MNTERIQTIIYIKQSVMSFCKLYLQKECRKNSPLRSAKPFLHSTNQLVESEDSANLFKGEA